MRTRTSSSGRATSSSTWSSSRHGTSKEVAVSTLSWTWDVDQVGSLERGSNIRFWGERLTSAPYRRTHPKVTSHGSLPRHSAMSLAWTPPRRCCSPRDRVTRLEFLVSVLSFLMAILLTSKKGSVRIRSCLMESQTVSRWPRLRTGCRGRKIPLEKAYGGRLDGFSSRVDQVSSCEQLDGINLRDLPPLPIILTISSHFP